MLDSVCGGGEGRGTGHGAWFGHTASAEVTVSMKEGSQIVGALRSKLLSLHLEFKGIGHCICLCTLQKPQCMLGSYRGTKILVSKDD